MRNKNAKKATKRVMNHLLQGTDYEYDINESVKQVHLQEEDLLIKKRGMKIYNITKGQLITIWVFGIIGWIWALDSTGNPYIYGSNFASFLLWLIPLVLIFYTIGWRSKNKK